MPKLDSVKALRLVKFALLMGAKSNILTKSPDYILEKFDLSMGMPEEFLHQNLDSEKQALLKEYKDAWKGHFK